MAVAELHLAQHSQVVGPRLDRRLQQDVPVCLHSAREVIPVQQLGQQNVDVVVVAREHLEPLEAKAPRQPLQVFRNFPEHSGRAQGEHLLVFQKRAQQNAFEHLAVQQQVVVERGAGVAPELRDHVRGQRNVVQEHWFPWKQLLGVESVGLEHGQGGGKGLQSLPHVGPVDLLVLELRLRANVLRVEQEVLAFALNVDGEKRVQGKRRLARALRVRFRVCPESFVGSRRRRPERGAVGKLYSGRRARAEEPRQVRLERHDRASLV